MLRQIRGTMKTVGAYFIIALLVVAFAAWGVPEVQQMTQNHAVRVGGEGFSGLDVQKEFDRFVTNRRLATEGVYDREAAIAAGVQNQIVESIAIRSALDQESKQIGLLVPRETVREFLQTNEQFRNPRTGKFDNEALTGIMREYNYSIREFEDRLQSDLLRNQLTAALNAGGAAPKALIDSLVLRETETRTISYVTVTEDLAAPAAAATPEVLTAYYEKNSAQFMAPEFRTFTAATLKNSDYGDDGAASEEELRKLYDANKARYETPERRTIFQITLNEKARSDEAVSALKGGRPFEALAIENGKMLGDITFTEILKRDILDPKVGEAVFSAGDAGAVIGPIKGVFGYTIAQVTTITPASVRTFEEVRSELETETRSRDSTRKLFEAIEEIESARDTGASLRDAAQASAVAVSEFGPVDSFSFGKGGEIIAGIPGDVLKEAFRIEEGEESEAVELSDGSGYFFVAVTEIAPAAVIPFENVGEEVEARWRASDRGLRLAAVVKALRDATDEGKSLKDAAAAINRAPIVETVSRRSAGQTLTEPLVEQIFSAAKGETISGPAGAGDAELVIAIDDIAFDVEKVGPDDIGVFAQYVGNQLGQELVDAYANAVRDDVGVKVNQSQIDSLFADGQ
jgi:peptidyl-prolyl cis-trans isomerase D